MDIIVKIVARCLKLKHHLNDEELELITKELINEFEIGDYVEKIDFDYQRRERYLGGYSPDTKTLYFNVNAINENVMFRYSFENNIFTFQEYFLMQQLSIILHELRHVMQLKISNSDEDSVIKSILIDSDIKKFVNGEYQYFYEMFPCEKDANVFCYCKMLEILELSKYFENDDSKLINLYRHLLDYLLRGYQSEISLTNGSLEMFYITVLGNYEKLLELEKKAESLTTLEKLSINFNLEETDLKHIHIAEQLVWNGKNPVFVLSRKAKVKNDEGLNRKCKK